MALYALGDTHLSLGGNKAMDAFGGHWEGYVDKLRAGFAPLTEEDAVVLCGDLSWGMTLEEALPDFELLHNNCRFYGDVALCGTRGWFFEEEADGHNEKVFHREVLRLETSLKAAGETKKLCFLHYPPLYEGYICQEIVDLMELYGVEACYYGHLHGGSHRLAQEGRRGHVDYRLVAGDRLDFRPWKVLD